MRLTIAIPTFNRAKRLEKSLINLFLEIKSSTNQAEVSVYVSNNGSTDETEEIILKSKALYIENGISFSFKSLKTNQGFDSNVLSCYEGSDGEYIWFLSDDDNINKGSIDVILSDIKNYNLSCIFYNFDQYPYNIDSPYINEYQLFYEITEENISGVKKIIEWPKLSALVLKKYKLTLKSSPQNSGFAHVTLALLCAFKNGYILHSPKFLAYPDEDYKEHIDFVPYIGNNLDLVLRWVLREVNKASMYELLAPPYTDPFISSLNVLGAYYRGDHKIAMHLKNELWTTVRCEMRKGWCKRLRHCHSLKELVKFPISIIYGLCFKLLSINRLTK